MLKCRTCGGQYEPTLPDGTQYFHACPPLSVAELDAAVKAGRVTLPIDPATGVAETPAAAAERRTYTRPNARDENITASGRIKSAGAGVDELAPASPPVVRVP